MPKDNPPVLCDCENEEYENDLKAIAKERDFTTKNPFSGKEEPWISFCMPCFNEANRVADAMRSVLSQDYPNTELVIVNDGSRDRSAKKIQDTINQLPLEQQNRCKFINLKKNVGACTARNVAAAESRGDYLAFLPADAYLYPGVARLWVNTFADNPDCDFVYCGYRFVEDGSQFGKPDNKGVNYVSEPFQPYILETRNYIDGTYPIRRELFEKMGGWDPAIKSLQDWEYWLRAVKQFGAKGYYYPAIVFETEYPHAGGLSHDSSHNWLERVDQIKNKLNIPINKNCVVAFGAEFHAINIAKAIGADISPIPNFKPNHYEGLYFIGGYPQFIEQVDTAVRINRMSDVEGRPVSPASPTKRIMHWIGSDVYFMQELSRRALETDVNYYNQIIDVHLCEAPHIQKELKALGIKAKIVPIPPRKLYDLMSLPEKPTVACYLPDGGTAPIYNPQLMEAIALEMPNVHFIFYGKGMPMKKKKNIEYRVFNPDEKVYEKLIADSTVLVRLMVHDGLSLSIPEFATAGRQIVTNIKLDHVIVPEDSTIAGVVKAIRKALKLGVDKKGAEYWKKLMDPQKFKKTINDLLDYNPKEYWDNRAASWQNQASSYASDYDKKIVNQTINSLKPQTVLDVGCGNGQWSSLMPEDYMGIDISSKMVDIARKNYPARRFENVKLEDLPTKYQRGEKFDLAFCHTVFLHIKEKDVQKAVTALKKFAKKAIIIEPTVCKTINYQIHHDIPSLFKVIKTIPLKERTLYVVNLEE